MQIINELMNRLMKMEGVAENLKRQAREMNRRLRMGRNRRPGI